MVGTLLELNFFVLGAPYDGYYAIFSYIATLLVLLIDVYNKPLLRYLFDCMFCKYVPCTLVPHTPHR